MSGHPTERTYAEIYASTPHDVWLGKANGIATSDTYPCLCAGLGTPCDNSHPAPWFHCWCYGRRDIAKVPSYCCGRKHPIHTTKEATNA